MVIIAALTILFCGGNDTSFDTLKELISRHVMDTGRVDKINELIDEADKRIRECVNQLEELQEEIVELNRNYNSTPEQYDRVCTQVMKNVRLCREKVLDLRFKMKDLMTREEWEAVFKPSEK